MEILHFDKEIKNRNKGVLVLLFNCLILSTASTFFPPHTSFSEPLCYPVTIETSVTEQTSPTKIECGPEDGSTASFISARPVGISR